MKDEELLAFIALSETPGLGSLGARHLIDVMETAENIFRERKNIAKFAPDISERAVKALDTAEPFRRAEQELRFVQENHVQCLPITSEEYPSRLRECPDAPILLYYKGKGKLNALKAVSMVGTRNATPYGKQLCSSFLKELKEAFPETLVASGLAYGIDIAAHRAALACGLPTVAVLAHGLDRIYPSLHKDAAEEMQEHGGILTEYPSGTNPDRQNFVKRNRIIAGISDATIVVESALKGGSLITARIAGSYGRDCFAFPGRAGDTFSAGCNQLISSKQAELVQSAKDFIEAMCWETDEKEPAPQAIQRELLPDVSPEEQAIISCLQKNNELQTDTLVVRTNIPIQKMNALLIEMELKGIIKRLAGGTNRLLG